jgi:hypothetical protein
MRTGVGSTSCQRRSRNGRRATNVAEGERGTSGSPGRRNKIRAGEQELFLGSFRLDLISPQPRLDAAATEKGERFLVRLREFLVAEVDPLAIERDAKISERMLDGLEQIGALGMKVPETYADSGCRRSTTTARCRSPASRTRRSRRCSPPQSIGVAQPPMEFGSEEQKRKWLTLVARPHLRLPADRARREGFTSTAALKE